MNSSISISKKTAVKEKERSGVGDLAFLFSVVLLSALGVVFVYSASSYNAQVQYGDSFFFCRKQIIGFVIGLAAMVGISFLPYEKLKKTGLPALIVSLVLLALVFVPGVGKSNYGATRWIGFGSFTIQPSEIAKYGLILFISGYFAKNPARMRTLKGILPVLLAGGGICVLVILEPNMSVTMCIGAIMLGMIFLSGTSKKTFAVLVIPVLVLVPALIMAEPYRLRRSQTENCSASGSSIPVRNFGFCPFRKAILFFRSLPRRQAFSACLRCLCSSALFCGEDSVSQKIAIIFTDSCSFRGSCLPLPYKLPSMRSS